MLKQKPNLHIIWPFIKRLTRVYFCIFYATKFSWNEIRRWINYCSIGQSVFWGNFSTFRTQKAFSTVDWNKFRNFSRKSFFKWLIECGKRVSNSPGPLQFHFACFTRWVFMRTTTVKRSPEPSQAKPNQTEVNMICVNCLWSAQLFLFDQLKVAFERISFSQINTFTAQ